DVALDVDLDALDADAELRRPEAVGDGLAPGERRQRNFDRVRSEVAAADALRLVHGERVVADRHLAGQALAAEAGRELEGDVGPLRLALDPGDEAAECRCLAFCARHRAPPRRRVADDISRAWPVQPRVCSASGSTEGGAVRAVTFHATKEMRVAEAPDPGIQQPTDAIVRVTMA